MHLARIATFAVAFGMSCLADAAQYEFMTLDVPGASSTEPYGINNLGHIVGSYRDASGDHGFLYDGTTFHEVRFPGESVTNPRDINDLGHIVGYTGGVFDPQRGFVIDGASSRYLDFPGASHTRADGINKMGQIVGLYLLNTEVAGFLLDSADYSSIVVPGATRGTTATAINDSGTIVGHYGGGFTDGGFTLKGGEISFPMFGGPVADITSTGVMVGTEVHSDLGNIAGFVVPGMRLSIDTIEYPAAIHTFVEGTNDAGSLVGYYRDEAGSDHGFIARPVPEPAGITMAVLALIVVSCVRCASSIYNNVNDLTLFANDCGKGTERAPSP